MTDDELKQIEEHCGCGRNHTTEGVGECDVPALIAEVRRRAEPPKDNLRDVRVRNAALEEAARMAESALTDPPIVLAGRIRALKR